MEFSWRIDEHGEPIPGGAAVKRARAARGLNRGVLSAIWRSAAAGILRMGTSARGDEDNVFSGAAGGGRAYGGKLRDRYRVSGRRAYQYDEPDPMDRGGYRSTGAGDSPRAWRDLPGDGFHVGD